MKNKTSVRTTNTKTLTCIFLVVKNIGECTVQSTMYSFWLCSMATITAVSQYSPAILKQWAAATQPCPFPASHSSTYPILAFF